MRKIQLLKVIETRRFTYVGETQPHIKINGWLDGWMTCNFTSLSTFFQLYQDDGLLIIKGCLQWNPVYD